MKKRAQAQDEPILIQTVAQFWLKVVKFDSSGLASKENILATVLKTPE